jgi:ATP synthase F1 gamma subunit
MKNYLQYKTQLEGLKDVEETIKATEKIAARFVHNLTREKKALETYIFEVEKILARLSFYYPFLMSHPLLSKKPKKGKKALVVLSGDKGLVGGLWHGVVEFALEQKSNYQEFLIIGKKGSHYLREKGLSFSAFKGIRDDLPKEEIAQLGEMLISLFKSREIGGIDIAYPRFLSLVEQEPALINFLPFKFPELSAKKEPLGFPIFEPSVKSFFDELLERYIATFFYRIAVEAKLSEIASRIVATEHASKQTQNLVKKIAVEYFKERRKTITQRQIESFAVHRLYKGQL